ncbi:MAG: 50S ribosomal protein L15e [Thermoplasmata archaeon]|nr:50S ribosomal protein L15e [Thermoplasmata archaeon]
MVKNMYDYIGEVWKRPREGWLGELQWERMISWRKGPAITRIERPTRLDRARELGYKAKQGIIVVRSRVRRGGFNKPAIRAGRRPKRRGILKLTLKKSIQRIAEERAGRRYPNMEVLNSYYVGEDGMYKYYEVILVDRSHPAILHDKNLSWITKQKGRVFRGKTSSGQKGRGLRKSRGLKN